MTPPSDDGNDGAVTRRGYLATAGAGLAGAGLAAGTAAGQGNRYTRRIVISGENDRFQDYNQDMFLHVIESTDVTLDTKEFEKCNFADWAPDSTTAYRTQLIDRIQGNSDPVEKNAFVNETASYPLEAGSLYIVNNSKQCPGRYVGLEVEFFSGNTPSQEQGGDGQTNGDGAGFGALGALGALGAGALARAWRRD